MKVSLPHIPPRLLVINLIIALIITSSIGYGVFTLYSQNRNLTHSIQEIQNKLTTTQDSLNTLQNEDQVKKNLDLNAQMKQIQDTYTQSITVYEKLLDLKAKNTKLDSSFDVSYAKIVKYLADKNYASASATITDLDKKIDAETAKIAPPTSSTQVAVSNAPVSNTPPASGYARQQVQTDSGTFAVDIISADLSSTKVIIDTASDSDCHDNCPVLPLATYATRSGAFAAINGNFFCPQEYPSCAGKTGSYDTLVMNKNKHYFNSDNNVYSTIPAVIFSGTSGRFVGQTLQWGRDTGVDAVIANYPLLVSGFNIAFTENPNEPKFGQRGARTFVATKGSTVYIGVVYGATMGESAKVMKSLGFQDALNLDEGGSTALWLNGKYLAGPGRNIPTALLLIKR